jgi:hypothetical protein
LNFVCLYAKPKDGIILNRLKRNVIFLGIFWYFFDFFGFLDFLIFLDFLGVFGDDSMNEDESGYGRIFGGALTIVLVLLRVAISRSIEGGSEEGGNVMRGGGLKIGFLMF